MTSATSEPKFSAFRWLKKLPKKHNEAGLQGQLPTFCHKLITDTLATVKIACAKEQCKERFEKIWVGVCIWLSGRCPPPPSTFQNTLPHLEYLLVFHTSIQQSHNNPKLLFNNKWRVIIHYILMVTLAHCTNLFLQKKMKATNKQTKKGLFLVTKYRCLYIDYVDEYKEENVDSIKIRPSNLGSPPEFWSAFVDLNRASVQYRIHVAYKWSTTNISMHNRYPLQILQLQCKWVEKIVLEFNKGPNCFLKDTFITVTVS